MRKTFAFVIILMLVGYFYYFTSQREVGSTLTEDERLYNKLISYNFEKDYPLSSLEVVNLNSDFRQYIYGGEGKKKNIEEIVRLQRSLFSSGLVILNPYTKQMKGIEQELTKLKLNDDDKDNDVRIISVDVVQAIDENEDGTESIRLTEFFNTTEKYDYKYTLIEENGKWKIYGWEQLEKE